MAPLDHFLFSTLFETFVQGPEPLGCPGRPLSSQFVVAFGYVLPAPVLVHNHGMLVCVLLQNADVRLNQAEQVQFLRQSKVRRACLAHHAASHKQSRHLGSKLVLVALRLCFFSSPLSTKSLLPGFLPWTICLFVFLLKTLARARVPVLVLLHSHTHSPR